MTETIQTHHQFVAAAAAQSNRNLVAAASPKSMTRADDLRAQAADLEAAADAELNGKVAAVRRIETLLEIQARLRREIESLENLAGIAANRVNLRAALDCWVSLNVNPYAPANWASSADQIARAVAVAPEIPAVLTEKHAELDAAQSEVDAICKAHSFDLKKVVAAIRAPRGDTGQIIYTV